MITRIAMWSGPRNISTTMMRSFENRPDCAVIDEPLYAYYLKETGLAHPMREEVLAAQPTDWRTVIRDLTTNEPAPVWFQKHMCHHLLAGADRAWLADMEHFFLIRDPARMVASYANKRDTLRVEDLGLTEEAALFQDITNLKGTAPPVVDAQDMLAAPREMLIKLCDRLGIPFREEMLAWPPGKRESDGVWAPHWYNAVEDSTGFRAPATDPISLPPHLCRIVEACQPHYEALYTHRLTLD